MLQMLTILFDNLYFSKKIAIVRYCSLSSLFSDSLKESRKQAAQNLRKSIGSGNEQENDKIPSK